MSHRANLSSRRTGAAAVEFAVVAGPFVLLVFGILEYGRFAMTRHLLAHAAREGARLAVVNTDVNSNSNNQTTAAVQQRVQSGLANQPLENLQILVYEADDDGAWVSNAWETGATYQQNIAVEIQADYRPLLPFFRFVSPTGASTVPLTGKAVMRSEGS